MAFSGIKRHVAFWRFLGGMFLSTFISGNEIMRRGGKINLTAISFFIMLFIVRSLYPPFAENRILDVSMNVIGLTLLMAAFYHIFTGGGLSPLRVVRREFRRARGADRLVMKDVLDGWNLFRVNAYLEMRGSIETPLAVRWAGIVTDELKFETFSADIEWLVDSQTPPHLFAHFKMLGIADNELAAAFARSNVDDETALTAVAAAELDK